MADNDGGLFVPMSPRRVLDSRKPLGLSGRFTGGKPRTLALPAGLLAPDAIAITGNLTVTDVTYRGYAYLLPVAGKPFTSNINTPAHDTRANGVVSVLGSGQSIAVGYEAPAGGAQLVLDLTGYFVGAKPPAASATFVSPAPGTTVKLGPPGETVSWSVTGSTRSVALTQFSSSSTSAGCSSSWVVGTTITATSTDHAYTNYQLGKCYKYSLALNGDPASVTYSGTSQLTPAASKIPVLMYHVISPVIGTYVAGLVVDPSTFDAQMKALHDAGWTTITTADLGARLATNAFIPDKTFVISFDDGHDDGYVYAFPILQKYGFVASYYLITGRTGTPTNLTWDQAATLSKAGMEIATHTTNHDDVTSLQGADLVAQIGDSKAAIETNLASRGVNVTVTTFCYPYGDYSVEAENYLQVNGFTAALTEISGAVRRGMNVEQLPRVRVSRGESPSTLLSAIAGS
jgi:peptidoglycan/xylan/chitin deacetylase (PgdA/CDA1 family)